MRGYAIAGLLAALLPAAAFAQNNVNSSTARQSLEITGTAPSACLMASAPVTGGANATFTSSSQSSAQVRIDNMVDPQTAQVVAATINLALPITCNGSHRVVVRTTNGGLAREGNPAPAQGFRELVPYNVTAAWAGTTATGSSGTNPTININSADGAAGSLSINISVPPGGAPLVAGAYSDELIIELQVAS